MISIIAENDGDSDEKKEKCGGKNNKMR